MGRNNLHQLTHLIWLENFEWRSAIIFGCTYMYCGSSVIMVACCSLFTHLSSYSEVSITFLAIGIHFAFVSTNVGLGETHEFLSGFIESPPLILRAFSARANPRRRFYNQLAKTKLFFAFYYAGNYWLICRHEVYTHVPAGFLSSVNQISMTWNDFRWVAWGCNILLLGNNCVNSCSLVQGMSVRFVS